MAPRKTKLKVIDVPTPSTSKASLDDSTVAKKSRGLVKKTISELPLPTLPRESGNILVCGTGEMGQLGLGEDVMEKTRPALISTVKNVISIGAGGMHSLALTKDGSVFSWGCNDEGALGRDTSNDDGAEFEPRKVDLPQKAIKISVGDSHSACLLDDGRVFAWGSFRDSHGNMGLTLEGNKRQPVDILPGTKCVDIASGTDHLVILTLLGQIFTVGCGEQGQLGRVSMRTASGEGRRGKVSLLRPAEVHTKNFKLAEAIWATSYCTFYRERNSTNVYGFGLNNYNQLGLSKPCAMMQTPQLTNFENVADICGGQHHTIVLTNDKKCYVIGRKEYGRLGVGPLQNDLETLTIIKKFDKIPIKSVSCGDSCSFAITEKGEVYSWGMGSQNQLGLGNDEDVDTPQQLTGVQVKDKNILRVSGGGQHTVFIVEEKLKDDPVVPFANGNAKKATKTNAVKTNEGSSSESVVEEADSSVGDDTEKPSSSTGGDIQSGEVTTSFKKGRKKN